MRIVPKIIRLTLKEDSRVNIFTVAKTYQFL